MEIENQPHRTRNIFLAYSWDTLTRSIYMSIISPAIHTQYKNVVWNIRSGGESITLPKHIGQIEEFRNQNKQLFEVFAKNILLSDIFIADVTTLNANVLLELGIAINMNKNVLILSGVSVDKLPFDLKGFPIQIYKSTEDLQKKIFDYLDTFLGIKDMSFSSKTKGSYFVVPSGEVKAPPETINTGSQEGAFRIVRVPVTIPQMKDTKVRIQYKITKFHDNSNWFGFMFRSDEENGHYEPVYRGSLLVNARVQGNTDITLFPGNTVLMEGKNTHSPHDTTNYQALEIILEDNYIKVIGDKNSIEFEPINLVNFGYLYLACYQCEVEFKELEILNIDTTS